MEAYVNNLKYDKIAEAVYKSAIVIWVYHHLLTGLFKGSLHFSFSILVHGRHVFGRCEFKVYIYNYFEGQTVIYICTISTSS